MTATAAVKERPILFRGPMVRAILEGRKTQTRRLVKYPGKAITKSGRAPMLVDWNRAHVDPGGTEIFGPGPYLKVATAHPEDGWCKNPEHDVWNRIHCPYGYPEEGARLWVRERCRATELDNGDDGVEYEADNGFKVIENTKPAADRWVDLNCYRKTKGAWVNSIHMPRWACRIVLEIVKVRVERLQEIDWEEAYAEGFTEGAERYRWRARSSFQESWDSHNDAPFDWASNPWVWVVEFKRIAA